MGHKINPQGMRVGVINDWRSKWFSKKEYKENLKQDIEVRRSILKRWKNADIADVEIERSARAIKFIISTARPGVLIGRGGSGANDLQKFIKNTFLKNKLIFLK